MSKNAKTASFYQQVPAGTLLTDGEAYCIVREDGRWPLLDGGSSYLDALEDSPWDLALRWTPVEPSRVYLRAVPQEPDLPEPPQYIYRVCCPHDGDHLTDLYLRKSFPSRGEAYYEYCRGSNDNEYYSGDLEAIWEFLKDPAYLAMELEEETAAGVIEGDLLIKYQEDMTRAEVEKRVEAFLGEGYSIELLPSHDEEREYLAGFRATPLK